MIFLCLGNDDAAAFAPPAGAVVVDLSGAHRLRDDALYAASGTASSIPPGARVELRPARAPAAGRAA